jgi:transcriptional regulator with XRE-family HTH domain
MSTVEKALKGISQTELAAKVGISNASVSYILNGKRGVSVEMLRKIAGVLKVSMDDLDRHLQKFPAPKNPPWSTKAKARNSVAA